MMRHDLPRDRWRKSSHSTDNGGTCVETQQTADGLIAIGDSKNRPLGAFAFHPANWQAFVNSLKAEGL
ncbi:DUF397 domain-containing protein [Streptomyces sp. NPDC088124]|uniref:DUF397 domain-containing protein n=1 Tax=Streptomyces sp. NPDC088124 TaxID=3154654 RepID=UPI00342B9517